ncbi:MAG: ACT domain-containing protein [Planctomycetaceae bacterium]
MLLNFSHDVGSPETLKLLLVLTAADVSAVGPTVWTSWKVDLLLNLYRRTMMLLSGQTDLLEETARLNSIRAEVVALLSADEPAAETERRLSQFPAHYLLSTPADRVAEDLRIIARRSPDDIHVEGRYEPETDTVAYRVITHERMVGGCFYKLTGVLTSQRMEILSAEICTSQDGAIVDSYRVLDHDHAGEVPVFRIEAVAEVMRRVLTGEADVQTLLNPRRRFGPSRVQGPVSNLPMRIVIDNDWSDRYTAVEVFAHDRPGLLYQISRTIYELGLSVARAKISTHFDQVVDAFYVTDAAGSKIHDAQQLQMIHDRLAEEINRFESTAASEIADSAPARS